MSDATHTARFLDIHILQPLPYSNVNRDDLGSPKTLLYGGTTRSRVSSQSWKRAVRHHLEDALATAGGVDRTYRSRQAATRIARALTDRRWPTEAAEYASQDLLRTYADNDSAGTNVLLLLAQSQIDELAELADAHRDDITAAAADGLGKGKTKTKGIVPTPAVDTILSKVRGSVALFGRMIAALPDARVDAGVQVAHAFTTHATAIEVDFFTAVDDIPADAETGSAHMGSREFTSGVYYRYATIDLPDLARNVQGDPAVTRTLVEQFLRSFALSLPSGANAVTAPHTPPHLMYVAARADQPVSLAAAFETPVRPAPTGGYLDTSVTALAEHAAAVGAFVPAALWHGHVRATGATDTATALGDRYDDLDALVAAAAESLPA